MEKGGSGEKFYMKASFLLNDSYEEEYYDFIIRLTH